MKRIQQRINMNNTTDNEKIKKTVQKPCSNTSKSGANADKSMGSGKSMNMSAHDAGILQNQRRIQRLHLILSSRGFLRDVF